MPAQFATPSEGGTVFVSEHTVVDSGPTVVSEAQVERLEPGTLFDNRYRIEKVLGSGGMGVVYLAEDTASNQRIALKLINARLVADEGALDRLVDEGLTTRDIRHPNIVAVYDVARSGEQAYIVMERVEGQSLREWFVRRRNAGEEISVVAATGIVDAVLDGLKAAHDAGITHRDLKPENVMLLGDPAEGDYRLRILDFGIAKAVGPSAYSTAARLGSPDYMAPEQKNAPEAAKPSADLYSISRILYELLMEVRPEGEFQPPSQHRPDVPKGIDDLLRQGLSLYPPSRQQSVAEYRGQLRMAMAGDPISPEPEPDPIIATPEIPEHGKTGMVHAFTGGGASDEVQIKPLIGKPKTYKRWQLWVGVGFAALIAMMLLSEDFWEGFNEEAQRTYGTGGVVSQTWYDDYGNAFAVALEDGLLSGEGRIGGTPVEMTGSFRGGNLDLTIVTRSGESLAVIQGRASNPTHVPYTAIGNAIGTRTGTFHIGHRPGEE